MTDLRVLTDAADSADPAEGLRSVRALQRLQERLEAIHVANARTQGWSWQAIADALGSVAKQCIKNTTGGNDRVRTFRLSRPRRCGPSSGRGKGAWGNTIEPQHLLAGVLQSASRQLSAELAAFGLSADAVRDKLSAGTSEPCFDDDADALRVLGIDLPAVRDRVNRAFGAGTFDNALSSSGRRVRRGTLPFTKATKKVLELGLPEALAYKVSVIGSEHLLLGILRGADPVACGLITEHVEVDELRRSIDARLRRTA